MDKFRKFISGKLFTYYTTTTVAVVAVIGILLILNLLSAKFDYIADFTVDKRYTLSEDTKKFLGTIQKDVRIITFAPETNEQMDYVMKMVDAYKKNSSKIQFLTYDPDRNPAKARQYEVENNSLGYLIVESGKRQRKINIDEVMSDFQSGTAKVESQLTGAIQYVLDTREMVVYFLAGHSEIRADNFPTAKARIEDAGVILKDLDLLKQADIPADASAIAMIGPRVDLSEDEKAKIERYLNKSGKMLVMLNPGIVVNTAKIPNITSILKSYNIGLNNDLVAEESISNLLANYRLWFTPNLEAHEITNTTIKSGLRFVLAESGSLTELKDEKTGAKTQVLAKTSDKSWGDLDGDQQKSASETGGPLNVMMLSEKSSVTNPGKEVSRVVVYGNATGIVDDFTKRIVAEGNIEIFSNSIKWLTDYKETINIAPKALKTEYVQYSGYQAIYVIVAIVLLPLIFVIIGIVVWIRRRRL